MPTTTVPTKEATTEEVLAETPESKLTLQTKVKVVQDGPGDPYAYISDPEVREKLRAADKKEKNPNEDIINKLGDIQSEINLMYGNAPEAGTASGAIGAAIATLRGASNKGLVFLGEDSPLRPSQVKDSALESPESFKTQDPEEVKKVQAEVEKATEEAQKSNTPK